MKRYIIALVFLTLLCSCQEKFFTEGIDCEECYQEKPDSADLIIDLTINDTYDVIPLVVYKNEVEDNNIEYIDTAYGSPYYLYVPVNKKYSVAAEYNSGDKKIVAIDGTHLKIKHVWNACDEDCWVIEGQDMNASLKY